MLVKNINVLTYYSITINFHAWYTKNYHTLKSLDNYLACTVKTV